MWKRGEEACVSRLEQVEEGFRYVNEIKLVEDCGESRYVVGSAIGDGQEDMRMVGVLRPLLYLWICFKF